MDSLSIFDYNKNNTTNENNIINNTNIINKLFNFFSTTARLTACLLTDNNNLLSMYSNLNLLSV